MDIKRINAEDTWEIRHRVLWPNEAIDYIKVENDNSGIHYGIVEDSNIISVISMFISYDTAQFRKFATLGHKQGQGYGTKLLSHIMNEAVKLGIRYIWCNARKEKTGFYKRFGLVETKKGYKKNGTEYVIMGKYL